MFGKTNITSVKSSEEDNEVKGVMFFSYAEANVFPSNSLRLAKSGND